jgi:hypothetical protein
MLSSNTKRIDIRLDVVQWVNYFVGDKLSTEMTLG